MDTREYFTFDLSVIIFIPRYPSLENSAVKFVAGITNLVGNSLSRWLSCSILWQVLEMGFLESRAIVSQIIPLELKNPSSLSQIMHGKNVHNVLLTCMWDNNFFAYCICLEITSGFSCNILNVIIINRWYFTFLITSLMKIMLHYLYGFGCYYCCWITLNLLQKFTQSKWYYK